MSNKPNIFEDPDAWESDLVRRLSGAMAANADRAQAYSEGKIDGMVGDTEAEIFADTFSDSRDAPNFYANDGTGDALIDAMSQVEGWDGTVSDQELMASTIQGETGDYVGDKRLIFSAS